MAQFQLEVDPALDDRNGNAAVIGTVAPAGVIVVGVDGGTGHHASVMGKDGASVSSAHSVSTPSTVIVCSQRGKVKFTPLPDRVSGGVGLI